MWQMEQGWWSSISDSQHASFSLLSTLGKGGCEGEESPHSLSQTDTCGEICSPVDMTIFFSPGSIRGSSFNVNAEAART